jgi:hypothetical protein
VISTERIFHHEEQEEHEVVIAMNPHADVAISMPDFLFSIGIAAVASLPRNDNA